MASLRVGRGQIWSQPCTEGLGGTVLGTLGDGQACTGSRRSSRATAPISPLFLLPRRPLRCRWRPGAALANTHSTCSPCGPWASGTAWRWGSPTTAGAAAVPGWNPTAPGAATTGLTSAACVSATLASWVPGASARKGRARAGTRTCAGRQRASRCAAGAASAAATSAPASRANLARSMGPSASVITSPAPGTKESSAQVGASTSTVALSQSMPFTDCHGPAGSKRGPPLGVAPACRIQKQETVLLRCLRDS